jgi:hypothetical protein
MIDEEVYILVVKSKLYGKESFTYHSLKEAFQGLRRLMVRGMEQKDGVVRWYRIKGRKGISDDPASE